MKLKNPLIGLAVAGAIWVAGCSGGGNTPPPQEEISFSTAPPASLAVNATANIAASVQNDSQAGGVTWSCSPGNSLSTCGSFNPTQTASGATTVYTAPPNAGSATITATATDNTQVKESANVTITGPVTENFVFEVNGAEALDNGPNYYALAGAVTINTSTGAVANGEQDYNDGIGLTSPEPSGDTITGGTLTVDSTTGLGTLTLITNNSNLGASGTETLAVQFVNAKHAMVIQFDGSATSSGTLDLQTSTSGPTGNFAFAFSGVDPSAEPFVVGGVGAITGTALSGQNDSNDAGNIATAQTFSGTLGTTDSFGRGTVTSVTLFGSASASFVYYVVGTEAVRLMDVDSTDSAAGSAYGQGTGTFANASIGTSAFMLQSNWAGALYAAAGMLSTTAGSGTFTGVGDADSGGILVNASSFQGTYTIASSGYGSLAVTSGTISTVVGITNLGAYATDPNLNLLDPNNTSSGTGGALLVDLDTGSPAATGVLVPQTDTTTASFSGNYAFGAQDYNDISAVDIVVGEFDFVGQGTVTSGALAGTGDISDPFGAFQSTATLTNAAFAGTATPDSNNAGRYVLSTLGITPSTGGPLNLNVTIYQANGSQLFWVDTDDFSLFSGAILQQGGTVTPLSSARARPAKTSKH